MPEVVTRDQIRDLIRSENLRPSDFFAMEQLAADPVVKGIAEDRVRERIAGEFQRRKDAEERLEKIEKEHGPREAGFLEEIKSLKINAAKTQLGPLFQKQRTDRKLDDRQVKFIQARMERFNPAKPEEVEKEFNIYLDREIDEYGKLAKDVFGIVEKSVKKGNGKEGAEPGEVEPGEGEGDYLDPAKNEMIKLD